VVVRLKFEECFYLEKDMQCVSFILPESYLKCVYNVCNWKSLNPLLELELKCIKCIKCYSGN